MKARSERAFSADGKLASGHWDGKVRLWDVATGKNLGQLPGHTGNVFGVAFSPDGNTLASGSTDYTVKVWDLGSAGHAIQTVSAAIRPSVCRLN